ncbi:MAG: Coenzyme F420 hydrogenase/dehydrogenase, beta subunit C-terminal domain [Desulfamplus sp.]|nr:Coenzyme F420 hydrogenase/dehydrogenase, beta subunit C-terminal domain [Desulfamplus sp.]
MNTKINVISEIVQHNLCVGCGVCTAICPQKILYIRFSEHGEYLADITEQRKCGDKCSLCLSVCPFSDSSPNESEITNSIFMQIPNINYDSLIGFYLKTLVGSILNEDKRIESTSGGLATWIQEKLLLSGAVDAVINVQPDTDLLFSYKICNTADEIKTGARSCYYPVELSKLLDTIIHSNKRFAIIALPCVCKAIRNLQQKMPYCRKNIPFILGLTCGHNVSKGLIESVCARFGGNPHNITSVKFRKKDPMRYTSDFGIEIKYASTAGDEHSFTTHWTDGYGKYWTNRLFALHACNFCDDIYAECADASFMDAWLSRYKEDWRGHTIMVSRSEKINKLIEQYKEEISQTPISIKEVIQSQYSNLIFKRYKLKQRIKYLKGTGLRIPQKRESALHSIYEIGDQEEIALLYEISLASKHLWNQCDKNYEQFKGRIQTYFVEVDRVEKRKRIYRYLNAILRRLQLLLWRLQS